MQGNEKSAGKSQKKSGFRDFSQNSGRLSGQTAMN